MTHCDNRNTSSIAELQQRFPAWSVWISDTGTWWASHRDQLTLADAAAGLVPYLRAATADDLKALLSERCSR